MPPPPLLLLLLLCILPPLSSCLVAVPFAFWLAAMWLFRNVEKLAPPAVLLQASQLIHENEALKDDQALLTQELKRMQVEVRHAASSLAGHTVLLVHLLWCVDAAAEG